MISTSSSLPGCVITLVSKSSNVCNRCPLMETIRSPGRIPAISAGLISKTCPIWVVSVDFWTLSPAIKNIREKMIIPNAKFIAGPAMATNIRCSTGAEENSPGVPVCSSGFSPDIFTNPPNGNSEMQYSVSSFVKPASLGPNPIENFSTRMPHRFAARKCPSSWIKIRNPSDRMEIKTKMTASND